MKKARGKLEPQCLANFNVRSTGKLVTQLKNTKQNTLALFEADESARKLMEGFFHKNHEDHVAELGMNSLSR